MLEVRVPNLDCEGCVSKLKKALFKLKGTFYILSIKVLLLDPITTLVPLGKAEKKKEIRTSNAMSCA